MRTEELFIIEIERIPESRLFPRYLENSKRLTSHRCNGYILRAIRGISEGISRIMGDTHTSIDSSRSDLYEDSGSIAVAHCSRANRRFPKPFLYHYDPPNSFSPKYIACSALEVAGSLPSSAKPFQTHIQETGKKCLPSGEVDQ